MAAKRKMTKAKLEDRLAQVRAYAEDVSAAEAQIDKTSLDTANRLWALYQDNSWVSRLETPCDGRRGRPIIPTSRSQFSKWILAETGLDPSYTKRLLRAAEWLSNYRDLVPTNFSGERALRPLYEVEKLAELEVPTVAAHAAELAKGETITSAHTAAALKELKAIPERPTRDRDDVIALKVAKVYDLIEQLRKLDAVDELAALRDELTASA